MNIYDHPEQVPQVNDSTTNAQLIPTVKLLFHTVSQINQID